MGLFRKLSRKETLKFQLWAWEHYKAGSPIVQSWHPIVRKECLLINKLWHPIIRKECLLINKLEGNSSDKQDMGTDKGVVGTVGGVESWG